MKNVLKELKKLKNIQISLAQDSNIQENEYLIMMVEEIGKSLDRLFEMAYNYPTED